MHEALGSSTKRPERKRKEEEGRGEEEGAGEIAQSVKCLPCRHEDLSSIPRTQNTKVYVPLHACNPSAVEAETGGFLRLAS